MKTISSLLFVLLTFAGISQEISKQIDTTEKTILIQPLPISIFNELKTNGSGIEVTMYNASQTFSLPKLAGTNYFLSFLQGQSTVNFNKQNTAYVMILVKDDFYMDAEVSITNESAYIIFKKDGKKYYNLLNQVGIDFFRKFMLPQEPVVDKKAEPEIKPKLD